MARIGDVPAASRYDGVPVGPFFAYLFETQEGVPVDGTSASLRDLSPFTLRLVVPDALLDLAAADSESESVDLIQAAATGADTSGSANAVATALATVTAVGTGTGTVALEQFVAAGQFFAGTSGQFVSTIADALQAADVALQVQRILNAEPLTLLVNPMEFTVEHAKIQSFQSRGRFGYKFEAWGEEQPKLSFSGTTAGFVAGAVDTSSPYGAQATGSTSSPSGYQEAARRDSAAWQNFMALYLFYRNNGYIFDTVGKSEAHLFIGSVAIDYDQWTYVGHIDSFSYSFEEESPHKVTFDLTFTVSRMYDRNTAPAVVLPMASPTTSPSYTAGGTRTRTTQASLSGRQALGGYIETVASVAEIATTPLDILGRVLP